MGIFFSFFIGIFVVSMTATFVVLLLRYRGKRIVTCPETHAPVSAEINAALAAGSWLITRPRFVIKACSRWPERAGCDQACAPQVEASPEGTLVRSVVTQWYGERTCVYCATPIRDVGFSAVAPGVRGPDGTLRQWDDIPADQLPQVLANAAAVCPRCELAEEFRARFPRRIVERPETPLREHRVTRGHYEIVGPSDAVY